MDEKIKHAVRSYFTPGKDNVLYEEHECKFQYFSGLAVSRKKLNIESLHKEIHIAEPKAKILEISTKSSDDIGIQLSAFNLTWKLNGKEYPVECIFQGCKKFLGGGPYRDLIIGKPLDAKRDLRLKESGVLQCFIFRKQMWPLNPKSFFYDYLYLNALSTHTELHEKLLEFDTFTDVEFNPKKSINCQARSAAIFCSLVKQNKLHDYLMHPEEFKRYYPNPDQKNQEVLNLS